MWNNSLRLSEDLKKNTQKHKLLHEKQAVCPDEKIFIEQMRFQQFCKANTDFLINLHPYLLWWEFLGVNSHVNTSILGSQSQRLSCLVAGDVTSQKAV